MKRRKSKNESLAQKQAKINNWIIYRLKGCIAHIESAIRSNLFDPQSKAELTTARNNITYALKQLNKKEKSNG